MDRHAGGVWGGATGVVRVFPGAQTQKPHLVGVGYLVLQGSLTITYFHTGNPHYHRRGVVSRSCSGWEGVVPTRYGHQA